MIPKERISKSMCCQIRPHNLLELYFYDNDKLILRFFLFGNTENEHTVDSCYKGSGWTTDRFPYLGFPLLSICIYIEKNNKFNSKIKSYRYKTVSFILPNQRLFW